MAGCCIQYLIMNFLKISTGPFSAVYVILMRCCKDLFYRASFFNSCFYMNLKLSKLFVEMFQTSCLTWDPPKKTLPFQETSWLSGHVWSLQFGRFRKFLPLPSSAPSPLRRVQRNGAGYWKGVTRNLLSSKMSEKVQLWPKALNEYLKSGFFVCAISAHG